MLVMNESKKHAELLTMRLIQIICISIVFVSCGNQNSTQKKEQQTAIENEEINTENDTENTEITIIGTYEYGKFKLISESQKCQIIRY